MTLLPRFLPSGDTALTVELGNRIDRGLSTEVVRLGERIAKAAVAGAMAGVVETVPTFRSLLVHYDPRVTSSERLAAEIEALVDAPGENAEPTRLWRLPVCYEGELAPDLEEVALQADLSPAEVVGRHAAGRYHVYMLGFLPGFPYMGDVPEELQLPRRSTPRVRVPAGSVAIATSLTAIYTAENPGGWHLIGRTPPLSLFDPTREPPAVLRPGDQVAFDSVSRAEFDRLAVAAAKGELVPTSEPVP